MKIEIGPYEENRKVEIQLDSYDTWNMDHTLALIIVPLLKQLKETNHGYPASLTNEEWLAIQDKMIESFQMIIDNDGFCIYKEPEKLQKGLNLFSKYYMDLWD